MFFPFVSENRSPTVIAQSFTEGKLASLLRCLTVSRSLSAAGFFCARRSLLGLVLCAAATTAPAAVPSSFSTVIGHGLLCLSELDTGYFHAYLTKAFGPAYKHAEGAYWFKAGANLWGVPVSEVMVSDGLGDYTYIAAVADVTADRLEQSVVDAMGIRHNKTDATAAPPRESASGSMIVYFKTKSKIYCAKSQHLRPVQR